MPAYDSVIFTADEANLIQNTINQWGQNEHGTGMPLTEQTRQTVKDILSKVVGQVQSAFANPISFTPQEASFMQYLYIQSLTMHGKPAGDLDWTYWQHYDRSTRQLIINIINKIGGYYPQTY